MPAREGAAKSASIVGTGSTGEGITIDVAPAALSAVRVTVPGPRKRTQIGDEGKSPPVKGDHGAIFARKKGEARSLPASPRERQLLTAS